VGSLILYATLDIWETTSKGLYLLGDNLGVILLGSCKFVPSNQTLDLTGNGEWHGCYDPEPLSQFSTIYFALSVTRPSLVPSRAARTVTKSPDKSPDGPHD